MADLSILVGKSQYTRGQIMGTPLNLSASVSESLHVVANTITRTWMDSGDVAFEASPDHAVVTGYAARLRVYGNSSIVATMELGKPTPDGNNIIVVAMEGFFAGRAAGDYTVSILTTSAGGSTDGAESDPFTIPLPRPTEKVYISESLTVVRA